MDGFCHADNLSVYLTGYRRYLPEGFAKYFEMRQKALETLNTGRIRIDLQFLPGPDESKFGSNPVS